MRPAEGRWSRSHCCATSTWPTAWRTYRRLRELLPGHDIVVLHGIHALAHAAAMDAGLRWATAVFDPVLLPTASGPRRACRTSGPAIASPWWMLDRVLAPVTGRPLDDAPRAGRQRPTRPAAVPGALAAAAHGRLLAVDHPRPARPAGRDGGHRRVVRSIAACRIARRRRRLPGRWRAADRRSRSARCEASRPPSLRDAVDRLLSRPPGRRPGTVRAGSPRRRACSASSAVDHRALFPRAALVVHHGGAGTTHAVVAAGRAVGGRAPRRRSALLG